MSSACRRNNSFFSLTNSNRCNTKSSTSGVILESVKSRMKMTEYNKSAYIERTVKKIIILKQNKNMQQEYCSARGATQALKCDLGSPANCNQLGLHCCFVWTCFIHCVLHAIRNHIMEWSNIEFCVQLGKIPWNILQHVEPLLCNNRGDKQIDQSRF